MTTTLSDVKVANTLNCLFDNVSKSVYTNIPNEYTADTAGVSNTIDSIVLKYSNHPSIINIKTHVTKSTFSFTEVNLSDITTELQMLDSNKACISNSIPTKLIKDNSCVCSEPLKCIINCGIKTSTFNDRLKVADVIPIHKKDDTTDKNNYRPISLLPTVSKLFERVIQKQIGIYVDRFLSPFLCGYRKGFNAQHALLMILEKWRISLDKKGYGGAILMDLSKAFDTLNHDLLIAKL